MPIRDDEQFEKYLKQFRPVAPEALPVKEQVGTKTAAVVASGVGRDGSGDSPRRNGVSVPALAPSSARTGQNKQARC